MRPTTETPRDFIDRLIRTLLGRAANLADFMRVAKPLLAPGFDFTRARPSQREFITDDWRRREADLLFEIPYRWGVDQEVLVWVLLEHQSDTDAIAPLRVLFETMMAWAGEWRAWRQRPVPRGSLRIHPVVPIVLYTANLPWGSNEMVRDLVEGPPELLAFLPNWGPYFWNLSDRSVEDLLAAGPFMQIMAVMRAEGEDATTFRDIVRRASANLSSLSESEMVRWQELIQGLLSYVLRRRPRPEHDPLVEIVRETNWRREVEVTVMVQTMADYLMEQGEARGELKLARRLLRSVLEKHLGALPEGVLQRIESCDDVQRLGNAIISAPQLAKLEDLEL
jgi:hypothetical protein